MMRWTIVSHLSPLPPYTSHVLITLGGAASSSSGSREAQLEKNPNADSTSRLGFLSVAYRASSKPLPSQRRFEHHSITSTIAGTSFPLPVSHLVDIVGNQERPLPSVMSRYVMLAYSDG